MPISDNNTENIDYSNPASVAAAAEAAITAAIADVDMAEGDGGPSCRFSAQFIPNKPGGTNGRYLSKLVHPDGREEVNFGGSKDTESKAIAACSALWPDVVLPEGARVQGALQAALTRFLGSIRSKVAHEKQVTRALVISKRDGVDINEALKMVQEHDAAAVTNEVADGPKDAPTPTDPASDDGDVFCD